MKKQTQLLDWQTQFFGTVLGINETFHQSVIPMKDMTAKDCCQIYKNGYSARLTEVLGDTFEATWWVLGDETFFEHALHFISHIPSRSYDLSDYGEEFPDYLSQTELTKEIPFLVDLANFEWLFKALFHSQDITDEDKSPFIKSLQQNSSTKIRLHTSALLFQSNYSIYDIWKNRGKDISALNEVEIDNKSYSVCYKTNQKVFVKSLSKNEYNILSSFQIGNSIEMVFENCDNHKNMTPDAIQSFFSEMSSLGLLTLDESINCD